MHVEDSINKVTLARRTGRTPAAVTKWVRRGLPVRADGTISWAVARVWIKENVNAARSGSYAFRQRQREQAPAPAQTPAPAPAPANGRNNHADADADAASDIPAYTTSLAKKEASIAGIRELELQTKRGELADVRNIGAWVRESITFNRDHIWAIPTVLRSHGHDKAADLVERALHRAFKDTEDHTRRRAQFYKILLPRPLPPPPAPDQLPGYVQYVRDAIDGRTEQVPFAERILSVEWRQAHPSIDVQGEFKIMAIKKQWDRDMGALLNRRGEWDLPPEHPATPAPELEDEQL
jgi:hypothetical protein